eukprot:TRINITY_DN53090_c0_g1_i1.p1 TRINITY_DN53090_c0_g1~~TRINITY_DN53090_c0_g1_i1.p1  ORF type:complete len:155 (-),score=10.21 TRINITY_DN53090_c0_g1_i1:37-501(-)
MPRRRSPSRSCSSPRKQRFSSRDRSRDRSRSRARDRGRDRSRDRGRDRSRERRGDRGGRSDEKEKGPDEKVLPEWGTTGFIHDLKHGGVGFITPHSGKVDGVDLFFHTSALKNASFNDLQINMEVSYVAVMDGAKNKPAARNIMLKDPPKGRRR